jgi:flavin-dependent dehydrogenase
VADREAATAFLQQRGVSAGDALSYAGIEGGFSLLRVGVSEDFEVVTVLAGSIVGAKVASGQAILDRFLKSQPWIGPRRFGGVRAIPLGRPYTHLVAPGVALVGDAASQVFSTHGSGIGIGLIAARLLGETLVEAHAAGGDIGSLDALWPYACRFHRRWGGLLGSSDAFRRFTQRLSADESRDLFDSGILTAAMLRDGLEQREMSIEPAELPSVIFSAVTHPWLAAKIVPVLARMPLISTLARSYPMGPPEDTPVLERYESMMAKLVDEA